MPPTPPAPIDANSLLSRCLEDASFLAEVLKLFQTTAGPTLAAITRAIRANDLPAVRHEAHKLKGSAGNLSAGVLRGIATDLEAQAIAGRVLDPEQTISQLSAEFERVLRDIPRVLAHAAGR